EESPLVGRYGSGTVFIANCNLSCIFCQNSEISHEGRGDLVNAEQLAIIMLALQNRGCHNVNLVSPTHVVPQILEALVLAVEKGLRVPLVYNSGGYDALETLQLLDGVVDIYMPDMKYSDDQIAKKLSGVSGYVPANRAAVKEMHRQVGDLEVDERGIAVRGLLVRHLVLPGDLAGTEQTASFLAQQISPNSYLNVMDQYRPCFRAFGHPQIGRRITRDEYQQAIAMAKAAGLTRLDSCRSYRFPPLL
ncbi:MAG: radical SAM protein, partial [Chloroflexota bacterium]